MDKLTLQPISKINGTVNLPGSKSVSNRALLLSVLSKGTTHLINILDSDDIQHMLMALTKLRVNYHLSKDKTVCEIEGLGRAFTTSASMELFLGNAGTAMRPLTAALCIGRGEYVLTGEPRMKERPIGHLVEALKAVGANISYLENENYPPLKIISTDISGGDVEIDGSISSQFLTAFLMTAPLFSGDSNIRIRGDLVSKPYIDITLHIMAQFGVNVVNGNYQMFHVQGKQSYQSPGKFLIEGDASSASYFLAAAAIKGGEVKVTGIGRHSIQGDASFANVLGRMGAKIEWGDNYIITRRSNLYAVDLDFNHMPDAAMTIAITALFAKGTTTIRNIRNWRVKETDRLSAMATELRKVGAIVEEGIDYITITSKPNLQHASIDTYDDHRMAMCFSLVALGDIPVTINDPNCTSKTFPDYFEKLESLAER
ncbi:3-phosphoshikimate 1-carboxyvinyltransferase [Candidatus Enterovibrio escicola]|uniref:3-phosphoshikimate 1-carboxyvinyltransferase n=1 Tax=Candidatus Enterovibrio escicola TaxID=1927127 RepID=UPI001237E331|nr:3-phosphoshikimate 1-carboxyvinyltransferase [Candidatus Enterovibrio escacola]